MDRRDEMRYLYNGGTCPNQRATRSNGRPPLRVCEFHRRRANKHQMDYQRRRRSLTAKSAADQATPKPRACHQEASPATPVHQADAVPSRMVFVLASERELKHLSSATGTISVGQPFEVISANQFTDLLRGIEIGRAIYAMEQSLDKTKLEPGPVPPIWDSVDLEPLPFEPVAGQEQPLPLLGDDADFVSSLFAEDGLFSMFP